MKKYDDNLEKAMAGVIQMECYVDHEIEKLSDDVFVAWNEFEIRLVAVEIKYKSFHKEEHKWYETLRKKLEVFGPDAIRLAADDINLNPASMHLDVAEVQILDDNHAFVKCTHDFNRR